MTPPLTQLAPQLWVASRPLPLIVGEIGARMTVIRLADGGLFLHSPVRLDQPTRDAIDGLGPVTAIVAPSKVHHLFVPDYRAGYPNAQVYGAPGLAAKRPDITFSAVLGDEAPGQWHGQLEQHLFRGAERLNEVVFFHPASRTLILTDLAFNVRADNTAGARLFYFLSGAAGRFGPHRLLRLMIRDRSAARASIERILGWDFDRIVVSHGDVLQSGGRQQLAAAFDYLSR